MKGIPLSDKEYNDTMEMLDSFRPENLHGKRPAKKKKVKNGSTIKHGKK